VNDLAVREARVEAVLDGLDLGQRVGQINQRLLGWKAVERRHGRWCAFVPGDALRIPEPELEATVIAWTGGYRVSVLARSFLSELTLLAERVDVSATVDTALITLFPGERHDFAVDCAPIEDPTALIRHGVLRTADEVLHAVSD